jgi:hypothetical protein
MNTIREEIILEIIERAAVIRSAGSPQAYATDIGETVLRARPKVDPDDLPCMVVWPQAETAENLHGKSRHKMPVKVEGLALFGAEDPSVVSERILGDLIKCFTSPSWDRTRAGSPVPSDYIESIVYQSGGMDSSLEDGSVSIGNQAAFLVTYYTAIGDPYTQ